MRASLAFVFATTLAVSSGPSAGASLARAQAATTAASTGDGAEERTWRTSLPWLVEPAEAQKRALSSGKLILAYFPTYADQHARATHEGFEKQILSGKTFQSFARDFVLLVVERGGEQRELPVGSRSVEHNAQAVLILDNDGWALSRIAVRNETEGAYAPLMNQIADLEKPARERKSLRQRVKKGDKAARLEWLTWAALSGQSIDLDEARAELTKLGVAERADKRVSVEVAVIINEAQAAGGKGLVLLGKDVKGAVGSRLWPYFADGYRPEDDTRDWAFLWSVLQHAEQTSDARGYERSMAALEKKGACGPMHDRMVETLARLKKQGTKGD